MSDVTVTLVPPPVPVPIAAGVFVGTVSGGGGGSVGYLHAQPTPATTWTINHNLGRRVSVMLVDPAGYTFEADARQQSPYNTVVVSLTTALGGHAVIT